MKKKWIAMMALALSLLMLSGCAETEDMQTVMATVTEVTEETTPATIPADGNPEDVTCKGTYTGTTDMDAVVASVDGGKLTGGALNAWYWMAVADYRQGEYEEAPDFDKPLDTQVCQIDSSVNSWQQYFLRQALNNWHSAQALKLQGDGEGLEPEEAYQPNLVNHGIYLTDIPAMKYHYSYNLEVYHPNSMHQEYLDSIPQLLNTLALDAGYLYGADLAQGAFGTSLAELLNAAELYNWGYMYFTTLSYGVKDAMEKETAETEKEKTKEDAQPETAAGGEKLVTFRQILLVPEDIIQEDDIPEWKKKKMEPTEPVILEEVKVAEDGTVNCSEEAWGITLTKAEKLLKAWKKEWKHGESTFADLARKNSQDPGSTVNGGVYRNVRKGQMTKVLDDWCFDEARQEGDTEILRSEYGYHVLYFCGAGDAAQLQETEEQTARRQAALITAAREKYPMTVDYSKILLSEGKAVVSGNDLLYPDIAHERYPEAPLFLQQDYPKTMYGGYPIRTNGCGITTMAMLATYMTDEEWTPPEMCAKYGRYSFDTGTDGRIFVLEPPVLGFYCKERTYDPPTAKQALADGYTVVVVQHKGYWTRGGHYLLLEKMHEDGTIQVRDSNIFNYGKLDGHDVDAFDWKYIPPNASAYWIFEKKITSIPACIRCGAPEGVMLSLLKEDYTCEKCAPAVLRRDTYQTACVADMQK